MNLKHMIVPAAAFVLIGILATQQAYAVTPMLMQGTRSMNISGMLDDDGEDMNITAAASYGYFLMDYIEAGVNVAALFAGSDHKLISGGVFGEYNIDIGGQVVPYAGAGIGLTWWDSEFDSDTYFTASGYGGARYFFVDHAAVGARLAVSIASEDIYNGGEDAADWTVLVDTSWYF